MDLAAIKRIIISNWPVLTLLLVNVILFATNYDSDTYLTGWDNLHPEFDIRTNIERSIFAVWQEYQSVGLLGGMGHAADLVRQIYLLILSYIFPDSILRYISTFTALFLGGIGAYYLISFLLKNEIDDTKFKNANLKLCAFVGALFYTLNLGTIQTFYAPFEAFIYHFAALPWLLLSSILFIKNSKLKNLIFLVIVLILATPSAYIPTLFVAFILGLLIYVLTTLIVSKNKHETIINSTKLGLVILFVNAFWLLPFLYFTAVGSDTNVNAKMNQMATETIFMQNKEFGTLFDVPLLRGFWFNNVDPNLNGDFTYMFAPWKTHISSVTELLGYTLFILILLGAIRTLTLALKRTSDRNHRAISLALFLLFLFSFTMLATDTPIFSTINEYFRKFPLFNQAFRFPFTKFNSLAALFYSIMLTFGITFAMKKIKINDHRLRDIFQYALPIIVFSIIIWIARPAFMGHLFYEKQTISIPDEYFKTFNYFKEQNQNTRIANLPQPTFWGWTFYRWGYGGSGFPWYGIKQPILDRAFDVWSQDSENYYYELATALYGKDKTAVENIFNKYQVSYLILDKNVIYPQAPKALFYEETERLLSDIPSVRKDTQIGNISIYKVTPKDEVNNFVFSAGSLPIGVSSTWNTKDTTYQKSGNYISLSPSSNYEINYPFNSLFTLKTNKEKNIEISNKDDIVITKKIFVPENSEIRIPQYFLKEKIVPVEIFALPEPNGTVMLSANIRTPRIEIDTANIWGQNTVIPLFTLPENTTFPVNVSINGISVFSINSRPRINEKVGTGFFTSLQNNSVVLSGGSNQEKAINNSVFSNIVLNYNPIQITRGEHTIKLSVPKINDSHLSLTPNLSLAKTEKCNNFRNGRIITSDNTEAGIKLATENTSACFAFYASTFLHDEGYVIFTDSKNISGRPFHFWALNEDQKSSLIDVYLDKSGGEQFLVLPPMEQAGLAYSFHFDNVSIGRSQAENELKSFSVYPIPYRFITDLEIVSTIPNEVHTQGFEIKSVEHPNTSLYIVKTGKIENKNTLILSQSYDPGWHAYRIRDGKQGLLPQIFPFIFGEEIKNHVEINSWENGWIIDQQTGNNNLIVIVYLPQYLQYLGFIASLTLLFSISIFAFKMKESKHSANSN